MFVMGAEAGPICRPVLTLKEVHFSQMQPPTLERRWTATVSTDASRCASTAGYFEVGFLRLKENSVDIEFREQFIWSSPSVKISVDLSAVGAYWIDSIQTCPCAR